MVQLEAIQQELLALPKEKRLKLAHWLLDSLVEASGKELPFAEMVDPNPLLKWAGMFSGGPGDTAERAEEILEMEVDKIGGFGKS